MAAASVQVRTCFDKGSCYCNEEAGFPRNEHGFDVGVYRKVVQAEQNRPMPEGWVRIYIMALLDSRRWNMRYR